MQKVEIRSENKVDAEGTGKCRKCNLGQDRFLLNDIIQHRRINSLYQPIFNLSDNTLFAYEALSRAPQDSPLHMPETLFAAARQQQRLYDLDCLCREVAIQNYKRWGFQGKLSLNIEPHSLMDPNFKEGKTLSLLKDAGVPNHQVILELTEQRRTDSYDELKQAVDHYREMGFSIALDDLSAGYSNLRLMAELEPEYIKLDKYFITSIEQNKLAYDFVALIVNLAKRIDCQVIAEGIETASELKVIRELGIDFVQGYLLGKPEEKPCLSIPDVLLETSRSIFDMGDEAQATDLSEDCMASLTLHPTPPCSLTTPAKEVLHRFQLNENLHVIPVLDQACVVGMLVRESVLQPFSTTYGHSLYRKTTAEKLMISDPLVMRASESIIHASKLSMARFPAHIYVPIIVCDQQDRYIGTVSIRELLERITEIQIKDARQCSPLTGLPGNISIEREIDGRLSKQQSFTCCYFDLDNFKAFNDYYGYGRGDMMIRLVAKILNDTKYDTDFIGHVGGDDFVLISSQADWQQRVERCLDEFEQQVVALYDTAERQQGGIYATSRQGILQYFPLSSLSVGALPCLSSRFLSRLDISAKIFELKHLAKLEQGNSLVVERRVAD